MKASNETNQRTQCVNKSQQLGRNYYAKVARETENCLQIAVLKISNISYAYEIFPAIN